jgi:iron complex outermembrane recepter protein
MKNPLQLFSKAAGILLSGLLLVSLSQNVCAQETVALSMRELKKLSIEELLNIEVVSVSKRLEKLSEVASAIQVITAEDIRRSGATCIPEALRLSPNLQVAQLNSHHWIISARGFNSTFANKLLVMIDGRTVYSPLFAGVFWDAQNVLLEDVDRIEIISGPGGTLWGANAVNGVINIITKSSQDTKGIYATAATGSFLRNQVAARYGGGIGSDLTYRVYAMHHNRDHTYLPGGEDNADKWRQSQAGFALDWKLSERNTLNTQGNFYSGIEKTKPETSSMDGQNVMARWTHNFAQGSDLNVQAYYDRTWRHDVPGTISDQLETYDLEFQHGFRLAKFNNILWGLGYRLMSDETSNATPFVGFLPKDRTMHLYSSFLQDEIILIPETLKLTVGTKVQHNDFSGFEVQPSFRIAWSHGRNTVWSAVSRAVRAPSRIDVDYHIPAYEVPPNQPNVAGGPNFDSEKVTAYELGYRMQPGSKGAFSLSTFFNRYDDLYSVEVLPGTLTYQIMNGVTGDAYGFEFSGNVEVTSGLRLRGGYTYFVKDLKNKPSNLADPIVLTSLGSDAKNIFLLQAILDVMKKFQFDVVARYVDDLPLTQFNKSVPSYFTVDARIAWASKNWELSVVGQNLLHDKHPEFASIEIPRNVYGKVTWRF